MMTLSYVKQQLLERAAAVGWPAVMISGHSAGNEHAWRNLVARAFQAELPDVEWQLAEHETRAARSVSRQAGAKDDIA